MDAKINKLKNGGRLVLSSANGITVAVERSGDGKTLRFIRETANGFSVIKLVAF